MRPITCHSIITPMQDETNTPDDFDASITCEEFYNDSEYPRDPWEDEDEDDGYEDDEEETDDEYEDEDEYYEEEEDEDDDEDEDWEDMEDDVSNMFMRDGTVSENGFVTLYDMERRGYFV